MSAEAPDPLSLPWRTGRHVGRTIYAVTGEPRADDEQLIGVMDTPELAAEAVQAHNRCLVAANRSALRREALGVMAREARAPG